jgi:hypothetical protein
MRDERADKPGVGAGIGERAGLHACAAKDERVVVPVRAESEERVELPVCAARCERADTDVGAEPVVRAVQRERTVNWERAVPPEGAVTAARPATGGNT